MDDPALALGVNAVGGKLTYAAVAEAFGFDNVPLSEVM
jgi:alanine dehydrogenase